MASGADRLSDLPDDLLLRVLHFAPTKEAASTTALSRRWRSQLWRSSGAVNLDTRIEAYDRNYRLYSHRWHGGADKRDPPAEALLFSRSAAGAALDAADVPVTRLTLRLEVVGDRDRDTMSPSTDRHVLGKLLSHRAARRVEELRLACSDEKGMFTLSLGSLPSQNLRVLDLTACKGLVPLPPASAVVFPRLSSLRLRHCTARTDALQSLMDAAPALGAIQLESVTIPQLPHDASVTEYHYPFGTRPPSTETVLLRCPAATVLVLDRCNWKVKARPWPHHDTKHVVLTVEIDAPRLQRFRYKGTLSPVLLSPPPPDLARADLHFSDNDPSRESDLVTFWRFLRSFPNARELKLRVTALEHIAAVLSKAWRHELLPVLSNLHRLELHGEHQPKGKTTAVAIANLLRCCPALRDLLIDLTAPPMTPSPEGVDQGANCKDDVSEITGLNRRGSFHCLRSSLTRVGLRFRLEDANYFGAKLIKFFADNAMVLEEMRIDAGNDKLDEHFACKVERWIADSSIRRKPPGASRFVVLSLKTRDRQLLVQTKGGDGLPVSVYDQ